MAKQVIDISSPDDGLGDPVRTAFDKTNDNFTEVYAVTDLLPSVTANQFLIGNAGGTAWAHRTLADTRTLLNVEDGADVTDITNVNAAAATVLGTVATGTWNADVIAHEYGGLEADVSAYSGLVKITAGATSAVTVTSFAETLLDDADAATARTTLGVTTNATHTGQVTGDGALTVDVTTISDQALVTAVGADTVLILDATDGALKKSLISDFASAGGDMAAATYDPTTVSGDAFDMDSMVEGTSLILTAAERAAIIANTAKATNATHTGQVTGSGALTLDVTSVTDQSLVTATGADTVLIVQGGVLKKSLISDLTSGVTNLTDTATNTTVTIHSSTGSDAVVTAAGGGNAGIMTDDMATKLAGIETGAEVNTTHFRPCDVSEHGAVYGSTGVEATNDAAIQTALSQSFADSGNRLAYITITGHLKISAEFGNFIDDGGVNKRIPVIVDGMGTGHVEMIGTATAIYMYSSDDMGAHSDLVTGLADIDGALDWETMPPGARPDGSYYKNQHFRVLRLSVTSSGGDCIDIDEGRFHNRAYLSDLWLRTNAIDKVALRTDSDCNDLHADNIRIDGCPKTAASISGRNLYFNRLKIVGCGMADYGNARTGVASGTGEIQLASDAPSVDLAGFQCAIVGGTSAGDYTPIIQTYNTSTKLATVSPAYTSTPDATSEYEVSTVTDPAILWAASGSVMSAGHGERNMGLFLSVTGNRNLIEAWMERNQFGVEHIYDGSTEESHSPVILNSGFWNEFRNFSWPTSASQIISNDTEFVYCDGGPEYETMSLLHNLRGENLDLRGMAAYASGADEGRAYWSLKTLEDNSDDITRSNLDSTATANSYAIFQGDTIKCRIIATDQQYSNRWIYPFDASTGYTTLSVPQDAMVYAKVRYSLNAAGAAYFAGRLRSLNNRAFEIQYRFGTDYYLRRYAQAYCDGVHEVTAVGLCDAHTVVASDFGLKMTHGDDAANPEYFVTIHSIEMCFSYPST